MSNSMASEFLCIIIFMVGVKAAFVQTTNYNFFPITVYDSNDLEFGI